MSLFILSVFLLSVCDCFFLFLLLPGWFLLLLLLIEFPFDFSTVLDTGNFRANMHIYTIFVPEALTTS